MAIGFLRTCALACLLLVGAGLELDAQQFRGRRRGPVFSPDQAAEPGGFMFCRMRYTSVRREWLGHGWDTDYPDSDHNMMLRISQLTSTEIAKNERGEPFHAVVSAIDDQLFLCPFVFMSDVGTASFSEAEADGLREYLLKGGVLWVDDFWGEQAWEQWAWEIGRVLPESEYPIVDIHPGHPILQTLYRVDELPQVPSIQFWRQNQRRSTSERGKESATPHLRAIFDLAGRPLVLMTHNTDIADGWEREGEDEDFFFLFSPQSYAVGINIILYALTH